MVTCAWVKKAFDVGFSFIVMSLCRDFFLEACCLLRQAVLPGGPEALAGGTRRAASRYTVCVLDTVSTQRRSAL